MKKYKHIFIEQNACRISLQSLRRRQQWDFQFRGVLSGIWMWASWERYNYINIAIWPSRQTMWATWVLRKASWVGFSLLSMPTAAEPSMPRRSGWYMVDLRLLISHLAFEQFTISLVWKHIIVTTSSHGRTGLSRPIWSFCQNRSNILLSSISLTNREIVVRPFYLTSIAIIPPSLLSSPASP